MSDRISQKELEKFYRKEQRKLGKDEVKTLIQERRLTGKDSRKEKSIFLCHSHDDKTIVHKIVMLFKKLDVSIYIDWMDGEMPPITNKDTAELIKTKIQHCDKFLFLATYYALKSRWCNWELGMAYSIKSIDKIAILPVESFSGKWEGNEYLNLYPVMKFEETDLEKVDLEKVHVRNDNKKTMLQEWLR